MIVITICKMVKYFKLLTLDPKNIDSIADGIVNMIFSKTYLVDGKLNLNPKPILYKSEIFDYEFHSNVMNILIFADKGTEKLLNENIFESIKSKIDLLKNSEIYLPFCLPACSQYTTIEILGVELAKTVYDIKEKMPEPFQYVINFVNPQTYLSEIIDGNIICEQDPLWTCIIDCKSIFSMEDGHMEIGFPKFSDLTLIKKGDVFCDQLQLNGQRHILVEEFAAIHGQKKKKSYYDPTIFSKKLDVTNLSDDVNEMLDHGMYYETYELKMDDPNFVPVARIPNTSNPIQDIINGALTKDPKLQNDDVFEYEEPKKELICYITGLPLYDYAYVLDIYCQTFYRRIRVEDMKNYPDAKEFSGSVELTEATEVDGIYVPHIESRLELEVYVEQRDVVTPLFQFRTFEDIENEKKNIADESKKRKVGIQTNKVSKPFKKNKKGMIDIEYTVNYHVPRSILVSPYFVHSRGGNNYPLNMFAQATMCHFVIWKLDLPVKFKDIIDTLPISAEKKLLFAALDKEPDTNRINLDGKQLGKFKIFTNKKNFDTALIERIDKPLTEKITYVYGKYVVDPST